MKTQNFKAICIAALVALFLTINVQAQNKMDKDTTKKMSKMSKMDKKKSDKKMNKMSQGKMKKDTGKM
ncbi:MAG TPA: hypothetical protein VGM63_17215 [Mucilaginibacter sp.]